MLKCAAARFPAVPHRKAMLYAPLLALAALGGSVTAPAQGALAPAVVKACPNAQAQPGERSAKALGAATVCLVNKVRTSRGLPALRRTAHLNSFAGSFSRRMVRANFFSHDVPGGPTFAERARSSAYARAARRMSMGENLAWATAELATPAAIVDAWMKSPGHRSNILRRKFRDIGLGVVQGAPEPGNLGGVAVTYVHAFGWRTLR